MRKSSRGNPNHYPKGDPQGRGGQFAPNGTSGTVVINNSAEYYDARTAYRKGEMTEEEYVQKSKYYSDITAQDPPTAKQKRFAEAIAKRLGKELPEETKKGYSDFIAENVDEFYGAKPKAEPVPPATKERPRPLGELIMPTEVGKGKEGAIAFTKECAEAFGADTNGVIFYSHKRGTAQGYVRSRIVDGRHKSVECAVASKRNKEEQIRTTYHEVFHLARNGCEAEKLTKTDHAIEETMAEVSATTMCKRNGINLVGHAYSEEIVTILPRLKQSEKYKECKTMSDFGEIFIADRRAGKAMLTEEKEILKRARLSEGTYLAQYGVSGAKHFDSVFSVAVPPKHRTDEFKTVLLSEYADGIEKLKQGKKLRDLNRNQRIIVSMCIRAVMEKEGIK